MRSSGAIKFLAFATLCCLPLLGDGNGAMRLFSRTSGYVIDDNRILWTDDLGVTWSDRTPWARSADGALTIGGIFFLSQSLGWLEFHDASVPGPISISHTTDAGKHWATVQFVAPNTGLQNGFAGESILSFVDQDHGWLLMVEMSGSAQRAGALFSTSDGGLTWSQLPYPPTAGQMTFITRDLGWLVGGPVSELLFKTNDGGRHWAAQQIAAPQHLAEYAEVDYGPPHFDGTGKGVLVAEFQSKGGSATAVVYGSQDSGSTWTVRSEYPSVANAHLAVSILSELTVCSGLMVDGNLIRLGNPEAGDRVFRLPFPASGHYRISKMEFADTLHGWIHLDGEQYLGAARGYASFSGWVKTDDGGSTFSTLFGK